MSSSTTYYDYREVKVKIAHRLFNMEGWKVYGYSADNSDPYTDYYDPAYWGGIATKNGYTLVIDHETAAEEVKRTYTVKTNYNPETAAKIKKLEKMTRENGASAQEEETAKAAIKKLQEKESAGEEVRTDYTPGHLANPPRCNWHIEKDGIIYDKGTGLLKFYRVPDISKENELKAWQDYNNQSEEEYKTAFINRYMSYWNATKEEAEKQANYSYERATESYKLLDEFNILLNRFNTIAGGMVCNSGEGYTYEMRKFTKYRKVFKFVESESGSFKDGQCFKLVHNFNYGCFSGTVYRFKSTFNGECVRGERVSMKSGKSLTGTANAANSFGYYAADTATEAHGRDKDKFLKWIETGAIVWGNVIEVSEPYEVEKAVKVDANGNEYKKPTAAKAKEETQTTGAADVKYIITQDTDTRDNSIIYVVTLSERVNHEQFNNIRDYIKSIGGYYSRFKRGFIFKEDPSEILNQEAAEETPTEATAEASEEVTQEAPKEAQPEFTTGGKIGKLHAEIERSGKKYIVDAAILPSEGETANHYEVMILDETGEECAITETTEAAEARKAFYNYCEFWQPESTKQNYGYTGSANDYLNETQIKALEAGEQITAGEGYTRAAYIATPYKNNVLFVYCIHQGNADTISPNTNANFYGILYNSKLYTNFESINEELTQDINAELKKQLPDEAAAEKNASNLEKYQLEQIENARGYEYSREAKKHFIEDTKPELILYVNFRGIDTATAINYITNPCETVLQLANDYKTARRQEILISYIHYNKTLEALKAIKEDKTHPAHLVKHIYTATKGGSEKTFKILLANGHTVKAEARAVRNIAYNDYISSYYIACNDRQYLNINEYGRAEGIKPEEIIKISHGSKEVYKKTA